MKDRRSLTNHKCCVCWFSSAAPFLLTAMVDLYTRDPRRQWYMFVDDDPFVFLNNTLSVLSGFNSSRKIVVGHFYCAWPAVVFGRNHNMQCMNFPQGAGVAISRRPTSPFGGPTHHREGSGLGTVCGRPGSDSRRWAIYHFSLGGRC
jgi:hypothetical protein